MKTFTSIAFSLFLLTTSFAQIDPVGKDKIAIGGYDVVAYFKDAKAVKGKAHIQSTQGGVKYHFSSEQNRTVFDANPESYLPQYDGYCALAVGAQNKKVSINPEEFKITDGKLYLFFNGPLPLSGRIFNSIEPWNKDEATLIKKADANWSKLKAKGK